LIAWITTSCAKKNRVRSLPPPPQRSVSIGETETGLASWYGVPYHGRPAANGEIFDMHACTAAHRTMPFGTWLRVDNLQNGKKVSVRVTDRGPFFEGRIIDLSRHAAERISLLGTGIAKVKLTVIESPAGMPKEVYGVQVAAVESKKEAERLREKFSATGKAATVRCGAKEAGKEEKSICRVTVGQGSREEAMSVRQKLRQDGVRGFLVRLDNPADAGRSCP
jgi:rare lipoprotein A